MKLTRTSLSGVMIIEPSVFKDARGYFFESYNSEIFKKNVGNVDFVQDNESRSSKGVVRGLHFQKPPYDQAKLVRCVDGCIVDVAVDLRVGSPTFGKHVTVELSGSNKRQLYIPRGFAHGFSVLSSTAIVSYKVDNFYSPESSDGIKCDDKDLNINWGLKYECIQLSANDEKLTLFRDFVSPFRYQ